MTSIRTEFFKNINMDEKYMKKPYLCNQNKIVESNKSIDGTII